MGLFDSLKIAATAKAAAPVPTGPAQFAAVQPDALPTDPSRRRLLFVGGDEGWLGQIERDLASQQPNWSCARATDSAQAVEKWVAGSFDTLILDGKIADGPKLLKSLEIELAQGICLVVCPTVDRTAIAHWRGSGGTLVSGESQAEVLVSNIRRAYCLQGWMANHALKNLLPQIRTLPIQSKLHSQVTDELNSENASLDVVGRLIAREPVVSAKLLQVVNSAFFGLTREISDPTESVMVLGSERIKTLLLLAGVFSQYSRSKCAGFSIEPVWGHSLEVGAYSWAITIEETKNPKLAEAAFTAGLLHDIGKLVLAENLPSMYETVLRLKAGKQLTDRAAEQEILGTTHAELGACLLATWGLPLSILEAIAWHHEPARSGQTGFSLLAAVHAANIFAQENKAGDAPRDAIDIVYLLHAGLGDCRNRWREDCGLEPKPDEETAAGNIHRRRESKEN